MQMSSAHNSRLLSEEKVGQNRPGQNVQTATDQGLNLIKYQKSSELPRVAAALSKDEVHIKYQPAYDQVRESQIARSQNAGMQENKHFNPRKDSDHNKVAFDKSKNAQNENDDSYHEGKSAKENVLFNTDTTAIAIAKNVYSSPQKRWQYGAQIVYQKETLVTEDEDLIQNERTDTSYSLQPTPDFALERKATPVQTAQQIQFNMPKNFLIKIDEHGLEDETEERIKQSKEQQLVKSLQSTKQISSRPGSPRSAVIATSPSPTKSSKPLTKQQKQARSKKIKKILKERLNVDCLRMLGEESADEDDDGRQTKKKIPMLNPNRNDQLNANDSYHGLMKEIDAGDNEGLSQAFLQKNGEAQRQELNSFTDMFSVRDLLGVGAFGVVLHVKNRVTSERSALKIINKERLSSRAQKILKNESTIMQTMNHPSVVSLKRIFENQKFIVLEMELIEGGILKRLFKLKDSKDKPKPLSDLEASKVMLSLLKGVAYVHARDIVHRDLKPENILLATEEDDCQDVKIIDFGLSAEQNWRQRQNEKAGTLIYMAPEQVTKKGYSKKIDLWACGIIAYQLLTCGQHPCYTKGEGDYAKKLENIEYKPIEWTFTDNFTPLAKDFFLKLCSFPPSKRYDATTALQHPWITRNSQDRIPMNPEQQFAVFEQERQLRKIMRLVYFCSHTKMSQCQSTSKNALLALSKQNSIEGSEKVSSPLSSEQTIQSPTVQARQKSPLKEAHRKSNMIGTRNAISQQCTMEESEITSPGKRSRKTKLGAAGPPESDDSQSTTQKTKQQQQPQYSHEVFLQDSFLAYKERLMSMSTEQSTSADSKTQKSEEKTQQEGIEDSGAKSDNFSKKLEVIDKVGASTNSSKQRQTTQKRLQKQRKYKQKQMTEVVPGPSPLFQTNINFNPQQDQHIIRTKTVDTSIIGSQQNVETSSNLKNLDKSGSQSAMKQPDPLPYLRHKAHFLSEKKPPKTANTITEKNGGDTQNRPGRNLIPMKSPDKLIVIQNKGLSIKEVSDFTTDDLSPQRTDGYFAIGKNRQHLRQPGGLTETPQTSYKQQNSGNRVIDVSQIEMNRQKNNLTSYPMTRDEFQNVSRDISLTGKSPFSGPSTIMGDNNDVDVSTSNILKNLSPREGLSVYNESKYSYSGQKYPTLNGFYNPSAKRIGDAADHLATDNDKSSTSPDKRFTRKFQQYPQQSHQQMLQQNKMMYNDHHKGNITGGAQVQDDNHLPNFLEHSVSGQTNETFNDGQQVQSPNKQKKKKRTGTKHQTMKALNQKAQNQQQISPFGGEVVGHSGGGNQGGTQVNFKTGTVISSSGQKGNFPRSTNEQKIDWFQLIQAEKTARGSKQLHEHLLRGKPIFEHHEEPRITSDNNSNNSNNKQNPTSTMLNVDYFQKNSHPMIMVPQKTLLQGIPSPLLQSNQTSDILSYNQQTPSKSGRPKGSKSPLISPLKKQTIQHYYNQNVEQQSQFYSSSASKPNTGVSSSGPDQQQQSSQNSNVSRQFQHQQHQQQKQIQQQLKSNGKIGSGVTSPQVGSSSLLLNSHSPDIRITTKITPLDGSQPQQILKRQKSSRVALEPIIQTKSLDININVIQPQLARYQQDSDGFVFSPQIELEQPSIKTTQSINSPFEAKNSSVVVLDTQEAPLMSVYREIGYEKMSIKSTKLPQSTTSSLSKQSSIVGSNRPQTLKTSTILNQSTSQETMFKNQHPVINMVNKRKVGPILQLNKNDSHTKVSNESILNRVGSNGNMLSYVLSHSHSDISLPTYSIKDTPIKKKNSVTKSRKTGSRAKGKNSGSTKSTVLQSIQHQTASANMAGQESRQVVSQPGSLMKNNNSDLSVLNNNKLLQHGQFSHISNLQSFSNNRVITEPSSVLNIIDEAQRTTFSQEHHHNLVKNQQVKPAAKTTKTKAQKKKAQAADSSNEPMTKSRSKHSSSVNKSNNSYINNQKIIQKQNGLVFGGAQTFDQRTNSYQHQHNQNYNQLQQTKKTPKVRNSGKDPFAIQGIQLGGDQQNR